MARRIGTMGKTKRGACGYETTPEDINIHVHVGFQSPAVACILGHHVQA
jgi:hypothetical protein